jgi:hypothetical protein
MSSPKVFMWMGIPVMIYLMIACTKGPANDVAADRTAAQTAAAATTLPHPLSVGELGDRG